MKIALVIDLYEDIGNGTSMSACRFLEGLKAKGHEVVVLCRSEESVTSTEKVGFRTLKIPGFQKIMEKQNACLARPDDERIREAFRDVDMVHIYLPFWLGTHCAQIAQEMGIPMIGCFHLSAENITYNIGMQHFPPAAEATYRLLKNWHYKYDRIKDIHCPSQYIAARALRCGYRQDMHVISNGYREQFAPRAVDRPEALQGKFIITAVGRLTAEKRQDIIIRALAKSKYRDDVVLYLAGRGPKEAKYVKLAKKLGVDLRICFCSCEELVDLLNLSDLYIQASDAETESISCLEAIACGTVPVISDSKRSATKQFALDERSIFRRANASSLAAKIDGWLCAPDDRMQMRAQYAEFAKKFALDKSIESILEVYEYVAAKHKKPDERAYLMVKDYNMETEERIPLSKRGRPLVDKGAAAQPAHMERI